MTNVIVPGALAKGDAQAITGTRPLAKIDLDNMEKLIALMVENDLNELQYEHGELKIELKRGCPGTAQAGHAAVMTALPGVPAAAPPVSEAQQDPNDGLVAIDSPMVGTFYTAPDPDSPPFVTIGTVVGEDTTVCLIEAMKVFNEIKAEVSGTVERIGVKNAEAVEYGQPLFYVRPN